MSIIEQNIPQLDEFDNRWLCPYCAQLTAPDDVACPHCAHPLVAKRRVVEERSVWLWRGFFLQFYGAVYALLYAVVLFVFDRLTNPFAVVAAYLNQPASTGPAVTGQPIVQAGLSLMLGVVVVYSVVLMVILYFRVSYGHILYLGNAGLVLFLSIVGLVVPSSTIVRVGSGLGLLLSLYQGSLAVRMWKDFSFLTRRLTMTIDSDATNATTLFDAGRAYARRGMWGKAAIHFRRAVGKNTGNLSYRLALIVAYININRADRAGQAWQEAHQLEPHNPKLTELAEIIQEKSKETPNL